jgi:hypothetical protein
MKIIGVLLCSVFCMHWADSRHYYNLAMFCYAGLDKCAGLYV